MQDADKTRCPYTANVLLYSDEEEAFLRAVAAYRQRSKRKFPSLSELLSVLKSLGYRKVEEPGPLPTFTKVSVGRPKKDGSQVLPQDNQDQG